MVTCVVSVILDHNGWCNTSETFYIFISKKGQMDLPGARIPGAYKVSAGQTYNS